MKIKPGTIVAIACIVLIVGAVGGYLIYTTYGGDEPTRSKPPVTKINHRPNAQFDYYYPGLFPVEGDTIYFNASRSTDPDSDPLLYYWDFNGTEDLNGDGNPNNDKQAEGLNVSKVFGADTYLVTLTVNDTKIEDTIRKNVGVGAKQEYIPPGALLSCAGKKEGITGTVRYLISVASIDPLYLAANYSVQIYYSLNDTLELYYEAPVSNLTGQLTYRDLDANGEMSQGDAFSLIPDDTIKAHDGDVFAITYLDETGPCGEVSLISFGLR